MLTVAKVTQVAAVGYAEYLEGKASASELGDYYLKDGERVEAPGRWVQGAGTVGSDPSERVSGEVLRALMAVRRPDTGGLLRRVGGSGEAVAAIDATFSAPKSVSAAWAVADPALRAQIEQAHEQAIDRAVVYAVEQVQMIRHRADRGTVIHATAAQVIATSWRHTTARAVDGRPPDPQLHSHVLLHAAVRGDGRVVAIDSRSWLVHRRELGAAYRTELAHELNQLGFQINRQTGRGGRYFELAGIPDTLIDRWSSRHRQVRAAIDRRLAAQEARLRAIATTGTGPERRDAQDRLGLLRRTGLAPNEERRMATHTRSGKGLTTHHELDQHWQHTADKHGLSARSLDEVRSPGAGLPAADPAWLLDGLTEFDAAFPARDARATALERSAGIPIADALSPLHELQQQREILRLSDGTATTREHRARERATVAIAQRLTRERVLPIDRQIVSTEIDRLDRELAQRGGRLSSEQRQAIELASADSPLVIIEGQAGTGKSTTLTGIARAHQAAGQQIVVTSTAALAATRLATELDTAGVRAQAYSTAALHAAIRTGRQALDPSMTVLHDEAALAGTREQHQLLAAVERSGARLIEIGDPQQNQPVSAGGLWPLLEQAAKQAGAHVELTVNQRARDPADQRDQALFRAGEHQQALRGYHQRDRVHLASDQAVAEDLALDHAHADWVAGKATAVIAQTSNERLDELNARAQAIRDQYGQLGRDSLPLPGRPYRLHQGDLAQIRRTIPVADHGQLRNGTMGVIAAIDPHARQALLELTDGTSLRLSEAQLAAGDVRLAYVQHPFPIQGQTTDTAHVIVAEHTTAEGSYVALTRAREQTHIYSTTRPDTDDPVSELAERMGRTEPELPSIRLALAHEHTITLEPDMPDEHEINQQPEPDHTPDLTPTSTPPPRRWPTRDHDPERNRELDRGEPRWSWEP